MKIGDWVLRTACQQLTAWRAAGVGDIVVAVNLSALQFTHGDLEQGVSALKTIAEGVTCEEVIGLLRDLGCDEAQGYLISKPFAARQLGDFLDTMQTARMLPAR